MPEQPELDEFETLVVDAIDRLPTQFQEELARIAVVRIVIYRDTLERDFGHDRALLAAQVERTLRHELAHHLGWDERGVGGLGL